MQNRRTAFTLVEILIVVIILGVMAMIVIPRFTNAAEEARESSLGQNLQTMRRQIELYRLEHLDFYPTVFDGLGSQLTQKTQDSGTPVANGDRGPYLLSIPVNPFNNKATVEVEAGCGGCGDGSHGWHFDTTTGHFAPDDADHADR